jgi:hypothetical protein
LLLTAALISLSSAAKANFSFELSGPSSINAGENASFNVHIEYSPIDPYIYDHDSPYVVSGMVYDLNVGAIAYGGLSIRNNSGNLVTPLEMQRLTYGNTNPYTGITIGDFNPSNAFETDFSFISALTSPGQYSLSFMGLTFETIDRLPTSLCQLDVGCDPQIMTDYYTFHSEATSIPVALSVSVVPETGPYAMLLAGLGLMGAVVLRRK